MYRDLKKRQTKLEAMLVDQVRWTIVERNLTQSEVAVHVGTSDKHLCEVLCGHASASFDLWQRLFDYLDIRVDDMRKF